MAGGLLPPLGTSDMEWPSLPACPSAPCPGGTSGRGLAWCVVGRCLPLLDLLFFFSHGLAPVSTPIKGCFLKKKHVHGVHVDEPM